MKLEAIYYKLAPVFADKIWGNIVLPTDLYLEVSTDSTNLFKSRLDKFWKSYDIVYDYKA